MTFINQVAFGLAAELETPKLSIHLLWSLVLLNPSEANSLAHLRFFNLSDLAPLVTFASHHAILAATA
jgi:hypothetical protein